MSIIKLNFFASFFTKFDRSAVKNDLLGDFFEKKGAAG